jgi:hypothetical protein
MLDLNLIFSNSYGTISLIFTATVSAVITYKFYNYDKEITLLNRLTKVEAVRAEKGLPSEVTITPEDFRLNPELVDILDVTGVNESVNISLETKAQFEYLQFQETVQAQNNFIESTVELFSNIVHSNILETIAYLLSFIF